MTCGSCGFDSRPLARKTGCSGDCARCARPCAASRPAPAAKSASSGHTFSIASSPTAIERLRILSGDARYDLSCACGTQGDERVRNERGDRWIYPVTLPNGGTSAFLRTLVDNRCSSDCAYCPLRSDQDVRRCLLDPEEIAALFLDYLRQRKVFGIFLTSSLSDDPDRSMARMIDTAAILRRRHGFRGYVHLKILPGTSDAAMQEALKLADAVSLNLEAPTQKRFQTLSRRKDYVADIVEPLKKLARWTSREGPFPRVGLTTQFVVGAAGESDFELVRTMGALYGRLGLSRAYFSAYQPGGGAAHLPGERDPASMGPDPLTREHRLYQSDFLLRKYGFSADEIPFGEDGNLVLEKDPKEVWAALHPERFPVDLDTADRFELLRVPGLGPVFVDRILKIRKSGGKIRHLAQIGEPWRLARVLPWVKQSA